ncbi:hypothetical protein BC832DRAFT_545500 [Gaertneriomyces semiglobifer]|nr:hypothetical protein BC832DRAFT_545500 [Gaertneriomyces semiglobifer]
MGLSGFVKGVLQVLALTMVLLTWSSVGRLFEAVTTPKDSLQVFFGPPRTPSRIHIGEIYNATLDWASTISTRKTFINVSMEIGLRCAGGKDGGLTYHLDNWIVQSKAGTAHFDYHMTPKDLREDLEDALCYLNIDYTYHPNVIRSKGKQEVAPVRVTKDKAMSAVFKLTRAPRIPALPRANRTMPLSAMKAADRILALQLRVDQSDSTTAPDDAQTDQLPTAGVPIVAGDIVMREPLYKDIPYTAVSIWPEDDPNWTLDNGVSMYAVMKWAVIVGAILGALQTRIVKNSVKRVVYTFTNWWGTDIENPLAPRKTSRSRRRSFFRDHLPTHHVS